MIDFPRDGKWMKILWSHWISTFISSSIYLVSPRVTLVTSIPSSRRSVSICTFRSKYQLELCGANEIRKKGWKGCQRWAFENINFHLTSNPSGHTSVRAVTVLSFAFLSTNAVHLRRPSLSLSSPSPAIINNNKPHSCHLITRRYSLASAFYAPLPYKFQ